MIESLKTTIYKLINNENPLNPMDDANKDLTEVEKAIQEKCNAVEKPLTEEEKQMDFSAMD